MASQLENELSWLKHYWDVWHRSGIVNSVSVDDWTAELVIIASNGISEEVHEY